IRDITGKIWISTENGIESFRIKNHSITAHEIYNQTYGAYLTDAENVLLGANGLPYWNVGPKKLVIDTSFMITKKGKPTFSFRNIEIDNRILSPTDKITLHPNQKLTIYYNTIDWGRENNLRLNYLLISNKKDTTERSVQNSGSIIINDVLPGKYRILLKANDNNTIFYSKAIKFTVNDFWFNTWTFRIVFGLLVLSGILFYFRQKAKRQTFLNEQLQKKVHEQTQLIERERDALLVSYHTIDKQNREKDVLIDEINHRVKNNLQFIAAILELQLDKQVSAEVIQALLETSRRIKAMSLVHELLYYKQEQKGLPMQIYIQELVDNLVEMAVDDASPVNIEMDIEDLIMDSKTALALGIIISELVSNSFKHAFENIQEPHIRIQLRKDSDSDFIRLTVSDNGTGFQTQPEFPNGLGSSLVDIFSRQLEGTYTKQTQGFFHYELLFKLNTNEKH
ncbi:MAG: sensor histidine kinase, partial [Bacteroidota bacterium]|nr:sensor histidine kinase [Bacteroidota bacterium]